VPEKRWNSWVGRPGLELLETVAEHDVGTGTCRLIVDLQDGRVTMLTRQERMKSTDLERF
jgi:hypothetical protein